MPKKVQELLKYALKFLLSKGFSSREASWEARLILSHLLYCKPLEIYLHDDFDESLIDKFYEILESRGEGVPLAHLLGEIEFYGYSFKVSPSVLIPRPETEILVEEALKKIPPQGRVLELGVGSGCVSLSLALERPDIKIVGIEISSEALEVAEHNRRHYRLQRRVFWVLGDWFSPLKKLPSFDLIVSNPPYVSRKEWENLSPEVRDFEPPLALIGGEEGLDFIYRTLEEAFFYLKPGGWLLLEIGFSQAEKVAQKAVQCGYDFHFVKDLSGIKRVLVARSLQKSMTALSKD